MDRQLKTSARMAFFMGIFLPLAETLRRFRQLTDPAAFLSWFDDYILGVVLLWAAVLVWRKNPALPLGSLPPGASAQGLCS